MHTANRMLVTTRGAARTRALGRRLARLLRPGDVVLLQGPLGAGKTTLVQGVGAGLGVEGRSTAPPSSCSRATTSRPPRTPPPVPRTAPTRSTTPICSG